MTDTTHLREIVGCMSCCDRPLIDTGYIGHKYEQHEAEGTHRWVGDGRLCCGSPAGSQHQTCYCGAGRWVSCSITAQRLADEALNETKIYRWSQDYALIAAHESSEATSRAGRHAVAGPP